MKLWIADNVVKSKAPPWITGWEWNTARVMFRSYANAMGLRDWWFEIERNYIEPSMGDDAPFARINITNGAKHARLELSRRWPAALNFGKKQSLVHELLHCHLKPVGDVVQFDLRQPLGEAMWNTIFPTFRRLEEYAVDGLADVIACMLPPYPVPPKPTKRRRKHARPHH